VRHAVLCPQGQRGQEDRHPALQLPDQARAHRQRGRPRHPRVGRAAAAGHARGRIHRRRVPRGRRPAHPLADRGRRPRRRMADRGAARDRHRAVPLADYESWFARSRSSCATSHPRALGRGAGPALRGRRRDRARQPDLRQRGADDPAAARFRREPDRDLPRPGPAAEPPLPRRVPLAGAELRRRRAAAPRQARHAGVAAGQGPRHVGVLRPGRRARRAAADLPVHRQRPRRGHAGQAACARDHHRPHDPADGPRRHVRRLAKLEQLLDEYATVAGARPGEGPDAARADLGGRHLRRAAPRHAPGIGMPGEAEFDDFVLHVDGYLCEIKDVQIRDGLHILGRAPEGDELVNDVLAIVRAAQVFGGVHGALPGLRRALAVAQGLAEDAEADPEHVDAARAVRSRPRRDAGRRRLGRRRRSAVRARAAQSPGVLSVLEFAAAEVVPRLRRTTDEIDQRAAGPERRLRPGRPVRLADPGPRQRAADRPQLLLRGPEGHPVAHGVGRRQRARRVPARAAQGRHRRLPALGRHHRLGHQRDAHPGRRHRRDPRAPRRAPDLGRRVRRVTGFEVVPLEELGRPRIDVTVRISGLLPRRVPARHRPARRRDPGSRPIGRADEDNYVRAHTRPTSRATATSAAPRPASSARSPARTAPACCR
jgi:hypothetical protein